MVKQLFNKFQNLEKKHQAIQEQYDKLAEKSTIVNSAIDEIKQKLLKLYVSKTKSMTITPSDDIKTRYTIDHFTITKDDNGVYDICGYNGYDLQVIIPTIAFCEVLFNNVKPLYNEI